MDSERDRKRKKDKHRDEDEIRSEKKSKNDRSRSRSPDETAEKQPRRKRRHSRSPLHDEPPKQERYWDNGPKAPEVKDEPPERKKKETDMLNTRTGGAYIPPARLRMMQAQITDKSSAPYQRLSWEALKKSIHGHINKINVGNIGIIIKELLRENIVRGRGLLCRSIIQAQAASPTFTNVYAALVAAVNSRFPNIGELLLKRLVIQFKRGFKRNDKPICISSASFIAHLVNQRVAHEILALELLTLLVETPTDDSVEVSIAFLKECGQKLTEVSSKGVNAIFEMLRNILHEGQLDKRVQYMIEVMFQVWKDGFKDHPALIEELELVPEEDQFTHLLMLDDATDPQDILNVFKLDEKYEENEQKYKNLCKEILGSDAESGEEDGSGSESGSEEDDEEGEEDEEKKVTIIDNTETNLVALRRTIYLTINSSLDFEECAHKLLKMQLKPGQEVELCHMFLDCCAEQRTYEKFYGLLAQRFCNINRIYIGPFEEIFKDSYGTAHRLDTNRLRNVSKFFAHLLFTDSISWEALDCVKLNEEDTTSSSRIYIKILFQELAEYMGLKKLNDRLKDPTLQDAFSGIFPRDNPKNTRFSINFFTSIGLGGLTDELREHLKQMPKNVLPANTEIKVTSDTDSSSSSSSDSSSSSSSESDEEAEKSKKKKKKDKTKQKKEDSPKTMRADIEQDKSKADKGERWGHDGFYDTYGKDARRMEPPRVERDKDNFVIPRNPRDRGDRPRRDDERRRDKNDDDRRRDRNEDDRRDDDRRRDRNDDDRREDDRRRNRNEDDRKDEDRRRDRTEDEKRDDDRRRDRKTDDRRRDRNEDDRRDEGRWDADRDRNGDNKNDERRTRDQDRRDVDRNRNGDNRKDKENGEKRARDEDPRSKDSDRERDSGYESRNRSRNEDREDVRRNKDQRTEYESRRKDKNDDRDSEYKDKRDRDGDARETRHDDDRRSKDKRSTDESKSRRDKSDDEEEKHDEHRSDKRKKDKRNDSSKSSKYRDSNEDEKKSSKKRRDKADQSSDSEEDTKSKDKRNESSKSSKHRHSSDDEKKSSKKRRDKAEPSSDSEEETKSRKRDKKKKKKKSKEEKENSWDIKSKRAVERQSKNTNVVGSYYKNEVHSEDWDIQRESSIAPEGGRYWHKEGGERGTPEKRREKV